MNLVYLSSQNLNDRMFVRDFVHNFKWKTPTLILHETIGASPETSVFATKRLSSLLSETMVYNNVFSAAQRDFFHFKEDKIALHSDKILKLLDIVPVLLLSPVMKKEGQEIAADALAMLIAAREVFEVETVTIFTHNPLSPLANKKKIIDNETEKAELLAVYEEEASVLDLALRLRPAKICSPVNYSM